MNPQPPTKARRRRRTGVLAAAILALLVSLALRFAGAEAARATQEGGTSHKAPVAESAAGAACPDDRTMAAYLAALNERAANLEARESRLADRVKALDVAERKLAENRNVLIEAEKRLAATLAIADGAAESDLARLTSVYENMKPRDATGLFAAMAPEFAAGFLGRMRADAAARIMAGLAPEKAYAISIILAGRNAKAPRN